MKKTNLLLALALALATFKGQAQCTEANTLIAINQGFSSNNSEKAGQSFTACATGTLSELRMATWWSRNQPAGGSLFIYDGPDTTGVLLATIPNSTISFQVSSPHGLIYTPIDLSPYGIPVVSGNQYTFGFDSIIQLAINSTHIPNPYPGGQMYLGTTLLPSRDVIFEMDIEVDTSTWNGSTWSNGTPNANTHVTIASTSNTAPGDFSAQTLTIANGASLTLDSGDTATIGGYVTNNGNGLSGYGVLRFDGAGFADRIQLQGNALNWEGVVQLVSGTSLQTNGKLTLTASTAGNYGVLLGDGTLTDSLDVQAYLDLTGGGNDGRYYHLGAPFNKATLNDFNEPGAIMVSSSGSDGTAYEWDAANAQWVPAGSGDLSSNAVIGKGYALFAGTNSYGKFLRDGPGVLTLTGTPINSDVSIALAYNDGQGGSFASSSTEGWNFLANPYPAQLDWDVQDDQLPNGLNSTVYTWNGANYTSYVNEASTNTGTRYIAPFQGFFVQLSTNTTPNFVFDADARTAGETAPLNKTASANPQLDGVNLQVSAHNGTVQDDIYIGFEAQATTGYDREWDAQKLLNPDGVPNLSVSLGGALYSICRVPYNGPWSFPLKLDYATDGEAMTLTADRTNLQSFGQVTVEDLKTGTMHDLTLAAYNFTYNKGYGPQRFILHFGQPSIGIEETAEAPPLFAYATEQGLTVELGTLEDARITVFNLAGQLVATKQAGKGSVQIPLEKHGLYLLRVESPTQMETLKVIR